MKNLILIFTLTAGLTSISHAQHSGARSCDAQELNTDGTLNVQKFIDLFGYGQGELKMSNKASLVRTVSIPKYLATPHIHGLAKDLVTVLTFHSEAAGKLPGFTKGLTKNSSAIRGYNFDSRNSRFYESYGVSLFGSSGSALICTKNVPKGLTAATAVTAHKNAFVKIATGDFLQLPTNLAYYKCHLKGSLEDLSSALNTVLDEVYNKSLNNDENFYLHLSAGSRGSAEAALKKAYSSSRKTLASSYDCNALLTCLESRCSFEPSSSITELTK